MSEKDQAQTPGREQPQGEARPQADYSDRGGKGGGGGGGGERRRSPGRRRQGGQSAQQQQGQQRRGENSLNMEELRELTELFTEHKLTDFEFENAEIRVRLSRSLAPPPAAAPAPQQHAAPPTQAAGAQQHTPFAGNTSVGAHAPGGGHSTEAATPDVKAEDLHVITSPIVGTFYRAPAPTAESFVKAGSHVEPDTVVCIIEAMKLMNEILAETSGTVEKIYVENGQPVEYGQPLFGVKK